MKKIYQALTASLFLGCAAANASVTLNLFGGKLSNSSGSAIANGGLVLLVASTTDSIFTSPDTTASLTAGSFLSGDDVILAAFAVNSDNSGIAGGYASALTGLNYSGNINSGDLLQLYWFPTLTLSSTTVGQGTSYGIYRTDSATESGSQIAWVLPSDGQNVALQFLTTSGGGSLADSLGNATLTTVPEPATTAALLGGAAGLFVMYRRRQRKVAPAVSAS